MALSLSVPSEFGVSATYHRIGAMQINWQDRGITVTLFSYISETARASGKQPLGTLAVQLSSSDVTGDEPTRADLYAAIKARPEWSGAADA